MNILSYHEFYDNPNEYKFSRTYSQFARDLETKDFQLVTIDDAHKGCYKAFEMMERLGIRGVLFVPTSRVGQGKYLSWREIWEIGQYHEIGNHSHNHVNLRELSIEDIYDEISTANYLIKKHVGEQPTKFVPPFNKSNTHIENICEKLGLTLIKDRIDVLNDSK